MRIETPHKLWSMAGDLNYAIAGSVIEEIWMPEWSQKRFKRGRQAGHIHPSQLVGWYFSSVETHGKSLLLKLENFGAGTRYIGCNLGQGCWMVKDHHAYITPWTEAIYFSYVMYHPKGYNYQLLFYDRKHHGKLEIREHVHEIELLNRYGPAIDSPQFSLDWVRFVIENSFSNYNNIFQPFRLKTLLMEQRYFAGLTNKMVTEICFLANLYPEVLAKDLSEDQINRLFHAILVVFSTFSRRRGYHEYMIYGRYDCPVCHGKVRSHKIRNHITYYCPQCQDPNFREPQPISTQYVEEVLKITRTMEYVKTGYERFQTERFLLPADGGKTKVES